MQIPILNGIYTDGSGDFRTSYPRNLVPVPKQQGISEGYLRPADGILPLSDVSGVDRGGISWNGACYRVVGSKLIKVSENGAITELGDVGYSSAPVVFDYSFDRLAIASAGSLFYYNGSLSKVLDNDMGSVVDFVWVDGYFMTTDGNSLVVTELNDPMSVNPLKYGSAEIDPDPIVGLIKIRNEVYAVGRYTIEVFSNVGGNLFPFQRVAGAAIMRGSIGTHACCALSVNNMAGVAFLGGNRNEPNSIWFGVNCSTTQLATREINTILQGYSDSQLKSVELESRIDKNHSFLYVHLPDQTLVYDANASAAVGEPVWFTLTSSLVGLSTYRARHFVWCYGKWIVGDPTRAKLGVLTDKSSHHFGDVVGWDFCTKILYNENQGTIFHELELISLTGNVEIGKTSTVWTSYSNDGVTWSQEHARTAGRQGQRDIRLTWLSNGYMRSWRIQRFRGNSDAHLSMARLEARLEGLS